MTNKQKVQAMPPDTIFISGSCGGGPGAHRVFRRTTTGIEEAIKVGVKPKFLDCPMERMDDLEPGSLLVLSSSVPHEAWSLMSGFGCGIGDRDSEVAADERLHGFAGFSALP
jgi:hypothetical protein